MAAFTSSTIGRGVPARMKIPNQVETSKGASAGRAVRIGAMSVCGLGSALVMPSPFSAPSRT
jgi:hypothetical protein